MGVAAEERVDSLNEKDISGTVVMSKGRRKRKRGKKKKKKGSEIKPQLEQCDGK